MKLLVHEITGENAMTREDGEAVYRKIHPLLLEDAHVELDFTGVRRYLTVFFNFAIGRLYRDIDADKLDALLAFSNLNSLGEKVVNSVKNHARPYYNNEDYRQRVNTAILEQANNL